MKKLYLILLIAAFLTRIDSKAESTDFKYDGVMYTVIDEYAKTCKTKDGKYSSNGSVSGDLTLPANPKFGNVEYTLIEIGSDSFSYSSVTSVTIPASVTRIGRNAFTNCYELTQFTSLATSPAIMNDEAFSGSYDKIKVSVPDGSIGNYLATNWSLFENISDGSTIIDSYSDGILNYCLIPAVDDSKQNTAIVIPGDYALLTEITIPERISYTDQAGNTSRYYVSVIGYEAFKDCTNLKSITFNRRSSTSIIGEYAFAGTSINSIDLPATVEYIGAYALSGCKNLTDFVSPENNRVIGDYALYDCTAITGITFNDGLEKIGDFAFSMSSGYCTIPELNIPPTIKSIGTGAFSWLEIHKFNISDLAAWCSIKINGSSYWKKGDLDLYLNGTQLIDLIIPDGVERINPNAFSYFKNIKSVTLGMDVRSIGNGAFYYCRGIESVSLNEGLRFIGSAFGSCDALKQIAIPSTVETIDGTFTFCDSLESVTLNENLRSIGHSFRGCKALKQIIIPASVETIDDDAFSECKSLESVTLNESITSIGKHAFSYCYALKQINIPSSVEQIGQRAFYGCRLLEQIEIPGSIEKIDDYTFASCRSLKSLTLNEGIRFIGNSTFNNCRALKNIVIPSSVENIDEYAFSHCDSLESVTLKEGLRSIYTEAFNCAGLTQITIPSSVERIWKNAFHSNLSAVTFSDCSEGLFCSGAFPGVITTLYYGRPLDRLNRDFDTSSIKSLTIGNITDSIPPYLFNGHQALTTLRLGSSIKEIGEGSFSDCINLTEIIIPPSVENIGASVFAGNTKLESIIMGHSIKSIGEKAFDGCPVEAVYITAQTPPTTPNNAFSSYNGTLYLQGEHSLDAYYDAYTCWDRFNSYTMVEAIDLAVDGDRTISGKAGDRFQLTATIMPENVTLPHIFWRSTNPNVAIVDADGVVTLLAETDEIAAMAEDGNASAATCKIIAESLYADIPVAEVTVNNESFNNNSGLENIIYNIESPDDTIDFDAPLEIYNLSGIKLAGNIDQLSNGIYIIRQGYITKKILKK